MSFKDHFSNHADIYAKYRPEYPAELYDFLLANVKGLDLAWDCGTGNGQVAVELAKHFKKVIATDASSNQIEYAQPNEKVQYKVAPAENSGLPNHCADLITVGQALHWFDFDTFYKEVKRIAKPGALFAAWSYGIHQINNEVDAVVNHFYNNIIGTYWPPERQYVYEKYTTIPFPFKKINAPEMEIRLAWNLNDLLGYLISWSATQRYIKQHQVNPIDIIIDDLKAAWGNETDEKTIVWPVVFKAGVVD